MFLPAFLAVFGLQCSDPAPPPGGFLIDEAVDLQVTFSDGESTTAIARWPRDPAGACGWPLIIFTHGLNGSRYSVNGVARQFAEAGYFTLAYDLRGHDTATGLQTLWGQRERLDLVELIEWSDATFATLVDADRIGLGGVSQGGLMSFSTAAFSGLPIENNPWRAGVYPQIAAIVVENITAGFAPSFAPSGVGVHATLGTAFLSVGEVRYSPTIVSSLTDAVLTGDSAPWLGVVSDPTRDFGSLASSMSTAVLAMGAWDDFWFPPAQLVARMNEIPVGTPKKLYIGSVGHSTPANVDQRTRRDTWRRQWFDRQLKSIANGVDSGPWLTYAVTPADAAQYLDTNSLWEHGTSTSWPPPDRYEYPLYLAQGQQLDPVAPTAAQTPDQLHQQVLGSFGAADLLAAQFRLVSIEPSIPRVAAHWDSSPLPAPLRFAGSPKFRAFLESSDLSWQVGVSLWDIDELGGERFVTSGSYFTHSHVGGQIERLIELEPNVYEFPAGHSIRVRVENMHVHEPPVASILRYAPNVNEFTVQVLHELGAASALLLPVYAGAPLPYGWSQPNSQGCEPLVSASGAPSLVGGDPFTISAAQVLNNKEGMLLYGFGRKKKLLGGGSLWLNAPLRRTSRVDSGGAPAADDCSGAYSFDFGQRMRSGLYPELAAGVRVYCQLWSRDPQASGGSNLTHGLEFTLLP